VSSLAVIGGRVFAADAGPVWQSVSILSEGAHYGWPCAAGPGALPHARADCLATASRRGMPLVPAPHTPPLHYYTTPEVPPAPSTGSILFGPVPAAPWAITALAGWGGRLFIADASATWIRTILPGDVPSDEAAPFMRGVSAVDLKVTPAGALIYVDGKAGVVRLVAYNLPAATVAGPASLYSSRIPAPTPHAVVIVSRPDRWIPGWGSLPFVTRSSLTAEGSGALASWNVSLYTSCVGTGSGQTCEATALPQEGGAATSWTLPSPALTLPPGGGTLAVSLRLTSYEGYTASAQALVPSAGQASSCACKGGVRRWVPALPPPPAVGSLTASDPTLPSPARDSWEGDGGRGQGQWGSLPAQDATPLYGPIVLQPLPASSPWMPGAGNVSINLLSPIPPTLLATYTCTVRALLACDGPERPKSTPLPAVGPSPTATPVPASPSPSSSCCSVRQLSGLPSIFLLGHHPVLTFPAPELPQGGIGGATLEVSCTAHAAYGGLSSSRSGGYAPGTLAASSVLNLPVAGQAVRRCAPSARVPGPALPAPAWSHAPRTSIGLPPSASWSLPPSITLVLPSEPFWMPNTGGSMAPYPWGHKHAAATFTCASALIANFERSGAIGSSAGASQPLYTWSARLLSRASCSRDRLSCTSSTVLAAWNTTRSPVWSLALPSVPGTLEVTCTASMQGGSESETGSVRLPSWGEAVCLGRGESWPGISWSAAAEENEQAGGQWSRFRTQTWVPPATGSVSFPGSSSPPPLALSRAGGHGGLWESVPSMCAPSAGYGRPHGMPSPPTRAQTPHTAPWDTRDGASPAIIISSSRVWSPARTPGSGSALTFTADTPLAGLDGVMYEWTVMLLTSCSPAPGPSTCTAAPVLTLPGSRILSFTPPEGSGGTLEVTVHASATGVRPAVAVVRLGSAWGGSPACMCTEARSPATEYGAQSWAGEGRPYTGIAFTREPTPSFWGGSPMQPPVWTLGSAVVMLEALVLVAIVAAAATAFTNGTLAPAFDQAYLASVEASRSVASLFRKGSSSERSTPRAVDPNGAYAPLAGGSGSSVPRPSAPSSTSDEHRVPSAMMGAARGAASPGKPVDNPLLDRRGGSMPVDDDVMSDANEDSSVTSTAPPTSMPVGDNLRNKSGGAQRRDSVSQPASKSAEGGAGISLSSIGGSIRPQSSGRRLSDVVRSVMPTPSGPGASLSATLKPARKV
jgi:hypothetical protein